MNRTFCFKVAEILEESSDQDLQTQILIEIVVIKTPNVIILVL